MKTPPTPSTTNQMSNDMYSAGVVPEEPEFEIVPEDEDCDIDEDEVCGAEEEGEDEGDEPYISDDDGVTLGCSEARAAMNKRIAYIERKPKKIVFYSGSPLHSEPSSDVDNA